MIEEESLSRRAMKSRIFYLENRLKELSMFHRQDKKVWQKQLKELIVVNTRLEKELKKYKESDAKTLVGFLNLGNDYKPKIDRNYK